MAKKCMINREVKRAKLVKKFAAKRAELKKIISSVSSAYEAKEVAVAQLSKLPRDSSAVRKTNRCQLTGRSKGVYARFGLGRNKLREATMRGDVPGLRKASW
jgi:small subunit ribosomal protein S14